MEAPPQGIWYCEDCRARAGIPVAQETDDHAAAAAMAKLRRERGAELLIYDNSVPATDAPIARMRGYIWEIWRTNYVPATRHAGLQGALFFCINDWGQGDPWTQPMVHCCCCNSTFGPRLVAGYNSLLYPGVGPGAMMQDVVPLSSSIRWEMLSKALEDVEYFFLLDRLTLMRSSECGCGLQIDDASTSLTVLPRYKQCCDAVQRGHLALSRVGEATWAFPRMNQYDATSPYSTNTSLWQDVIDDVARSIEALLLQLET